MGPSDDEKASTSMSLKKTTIPGVQGEAGISRQSSEQKRKREQNARDEGHEGRAIVVQTPPPEF